MVEAIRTTQKALGQVRYGVGEQEAKSRVFRRSLFVVKDVKREKYLPKRTSDPFDRAMGSHRNILTMSWAG